MNPNPQLFALKASAELAGTILAGVEKHSVADGFFAGLSINTVREGNLPSGCVGVLTTPDGSLVLLMRTTDTPAQ